MDWAATYGGITHYFDNCTKEEAKRELTKRLGPLQVALVKRFRFYSLN